MVGTDFNTRHDPLESGVRSLTPADIGKERLWAFIESLQNEIAAVQEGKHSLLLSAAHVICTTGAISPQGISKEPHIHFKMGYNAFGSLFHRLQAYKKHCEDLGEYPRTLVPTNLSLQIESIRKFEAILILSLKEEDIDRIYGSVWKQ